MKRSIAATIATAAFCIALTGCHSSNTVSPSTPEKRIAVASLPDRAAAVAEQLKPWTSLKVPVSIKLTSPGKITLSGTAVMERGRALSISLRFMGMVSVGSLTVTTDSVTVIDTYHKMYLSESTSKLLRGLPFDISDLQDLLLGRPFAAGADGLPTDKLTLSLADPEGWSMTPDFNSGGWTYSFIFDDNDVVTSAVLDRKGAAAATVSYSDVDSSTPAGPVAAVATLDVPGRRPVALAVTWRMARADWGAGSVTIPSIPSGYRRVTLDNIADILGSF